MNGTAPRRVVVVGGGITGLVAARRLRKDHPEIDVTIFEESARLGGKIKTERIAGVPVEAGADWFLTRQPAALELVHELGLESALVTPARTGAYVWSGGSLRKLIPDLVRGVPKRPVEAMRAGLLSPRGTVRALTDLFRPSPLRGPDISVGSLVRRRFGDEVMDRLVDPMLAASRSGSADEMSLAAAAPELDKAARSHRSVIAGLRAAEPSPSIHPPFLGLRGGMAQLVDALVEDLRGTVVRTEARVDGIERAETGYVVRSGSEEIAADGVIVGVPAYAASRIVSTLDAGLSSELSRIRYEPAVVLTLVYPTSAGAPPAEGSGMLVPTTEGRLLTACAWYSEKWDHARPEGGSSIFRCFVGRAGAGEMVDEHLVSAVAEELRDALGLAGAPTDHALTRWDAALPVYRVGHLDLMDGIERKLAEHPGLALAGAGYRGSGLPDCIAQGTGAARAVGALLAANGR